MLFVISKFGRNNLFRHEASLNNFIASEPYQLPWHHRHIVGSNSYFGYLVWVEITSVRKQELTKTRTTMQLETPGLHVLLKIH